MSQAKVIEPQKTCVITRGYYRQTEVDFIRATLRGQVAESVKCVRPVEDEAVVAIKFRRSGSDVTWLRIDR